MYIDFDIEGMYMYHDILLHASGSSINEPPSQETDSCTLGDELRFFTGADFPPPLGCDKKHALKFLVNSKEKILPTA